MNSMTNPAPSKLRTVHAAMASTVQEAGDDVARAMYVKARQFNDLYFDGALTALLVEITAPASPRALATHQPRTPEGVDCVIRIAPGVVSGGPLVWEDVLLHEMIHVWQAETGNQEPGYQGHGPKFAAKCNEIGAKLELPPVGVKGRGKDASGAKLPNCAQWPLNVRPAGYYPPETRGAKAAAPKAARQRRAKAADRDEAPESGPSSVDRVREALALVRAMSTDERLAFVDALADVTGGYEAD
jgi:hypothetical protein